MKYKVTHRWGAKWTGKKFAGGKIRTTTLIGKNWISAIKNKRLGVISKVKETR